MLASPEDQVTLQLRQLPNRSLSMSEYQPLFNWSRADNETRVMLTHYRPNYLLDFQTDYRHCLKVCVDHWLRLRMGDRSNQDRCRLVVVGQSLAKRPSPPQAVAGRKTLYQCAFYDFDNLDSMLGSREKAEEVKIFIMNKTYLRYDRPLPATINRPMLNNLENRSVAFYHRSRAAGVGECVQLCRRQGEEAAEGQVNDVWKENKCRIVVAMPLVRYDATVDRNMTEVRCTTNLMIIDELDHCPFFFGSTPVPSTTSTWTSSSAASATMEHERKSDEPSSCDTNRSRWRRAKSYRGSISPSSMAKATRLASPWTCIGRCVG